MKHLIKYAKYNESADNEFRELIIIESIGFLMNPKDEILGYPYGITPNSEESKELVVLLKDFLKGRDLNENQKKMIMPVLIFVEGLHERGERDHTVTLKLDKFREDGQKATGILSKVKKEFPKMKRQKNPLTGE